MRSSIFCSFHGLLLLFVATSTILSSTAQSLASEKSPKLRGGSSNKSPSIIPKDEERSLENSNNNSNNQDNYRQWNYNGGYYRNYSNQRNNYMGHRYYGGYYGYGGKQYKANYGNNGYYKNTDDDNAGNDDQNQDTDDANQGSNEEENETDDLSFSNIFSSDLEEKFWEWYDSPPSDWTKPEWAWFSGTLVTVVGLIFCCCVGCAKLCTDSQDRACSKDQDFDDYVSIDSAKRGSFMTIDTTGSGDGTVVSDDRTYDSILRMRSSN